MAESKYDIKLSVCIFSAASLNYHAQYTLHNTLPNDKTTSEVLRVFGMTRPWIYQSGCATKCANCGSLLDVDLTVSVLQSTYLLYIHFLSDMCKGGGGGGSDVAKMSYILRHRGVQLILAYSWTRPAILVAGKDRGECFHFFCFFTFIPIPLSSLFRSFISSTISSITFSLSLGDDTK